MDAICRVETGEGPRDVVRRDDAWPAIAIFSMATRLVTGSA